MSFQYSIKFPIIPFQKIHENTQFILIGSCFTENIGTKLSFAGYDVTLNPFGIVFNPLSIALSIQRIIKNEEYKLSDLIQNHENRFVSFHHHGVFSGFDDEKVITQINLSLNNAHNKLKTANTLIITLGSAWIYEHLTSNQVVANCHKIASSQFKKRLLEVNEVVISLQETLTLIKKTYSNINIILTISPVKHLRDGVIENQQSKATLILAINELLKDAYPSFYYFPAYEIVTDELRDYRFFESDFAHPNQMAIDYIWERFKLSCFTEKALEKSFEAEKINKQLTHKTLHNELLIESLEQRIMAYLEKFKNK